MDSWLGKASYKLNLFGDVKHEVALVNHISGANEGDAENHPHLLNEAKANLPSGYMSTLACDKADDTNDVHELLSRACIRAVIQNRSLWKSDHKRMLPGRDGNLNTVYDEAGTVYCYNRVSQPMVRHKMAYIGCACALCPVPNKTDDSATPRYPGLIYYGPSG